jgi:hypothetical protein
MALSVALPEYVQAATGKRSSRTYNFLRESFVTSALPHTARRSITRAPQGTRQTPEFCEYPDVLKELVYILYQDRSLHEKVFGKLGVPPPSTLHRYKWYITREQEGGIFGAYEVVHTYLDVRELEGLSA